MLSGLDACMDLLPLDQPRYFMGLGDPIGIVESVARGVDMFDCVLPTRLARHGTILTDGGRYNLTRAEFATSTEPLDPACLKALPPGGRRAICVTFCSPRSRRRHGSSRFTTSPGSCVSWIRWLMRSGREPSRTSASASMTCGAPASLLRVRSRSSGISWAVWFFSHSCSGSCTSSSSGRSSASEGTAGSYPVARGRHDRRHELGIHGAIAEVEDKVIWLEVAPEIELKISKGAVAEIVTDEDDDENDDEGADDLAAGDADA